ncbi:MAG: ankyrin repeat domain-containing protein [Rickettsiaceae bacterium]|nr:ankyrin repeat domain-containing protein [Rickettsiaceae bacterium]
MANDSLEINGTPQESSGTLNAFDTDGLGVDQTLDEINQMLDIGLDLNAPDQDGITLLHKACMNSDFRLVCYLLELGASPNISSNGITPLIDACKRGDEAIVEILLANGADVNIKESIQKIENLKNDPSLDNIIRNRDGVIVERPSNHVTVKYTKGSVALGYLLEKCTKYELDAIKNGILPSAQDSDKNIRIIAKILEAYDGRFATPTPTITRNYKGSKPCLPGMIVTHVIKHVHVVGNEDIIDCINSINELRRSS